MKSGSKKTGILSLQAQGAAGVPGPPEYEPTLLTSLLFWGDCRQIEHRFIHSAGARN